MPLTSIPFRSTWFRHRAELGLCFLVAAGVTEASKRGGIRYNVQTTRSRSDGIMSVLYHGNGAWTYTTGRLGLDQGGGLVYKTGFLFLKNEYSAMSAAEVAFPGYSYTIYHAIGGRPRVVFIGSTRFLFSQ